MLLGYPGLVQQRLVNQGEYSQPKRNIVRTSTNTTGKATVTGNQFGAHIPGASAIKSILTLKTLTTHLALVHKLDADQRKPYVPSSKKAPFVPQTYPVPCNSKTVYRSPGELKKHLQSRAHAFSDAEVEPYSEPCRRHGSALATCRACFRGYNILRHLGYIDVLRGGLYICWPGILLFAG